MAFEWFTAKTCAAGVLNGVKTLASVVAKEVTTRAAKQQLDHLFVIETNALLKSQTHLSQALFALNLSKEEQRQLESFLNSEAFACIQRSSAALYARSVPGAEKMQCELLHRQLIALFPGTSDALLRDLSENLVQFAWSASGTAWQTALELGIVHQEWWSAVQIQQIVADEVANLSRQLEQGIAASSSLLNEIDIFSERYRRKLAFHFSKLRPQSLHESYEIPIEDLYVDPSFASLRPDDAPPWREGKMLSYAHRTVLLGNPGAGKSTFAGKLCYDLCTRYEDNIFAGRRLSPVFITMRELARSKRDSYCSIVEYIELQAKSEFQVDAPPNCFKILLLSGSLIVIFDGLDELIEISDRLTMKSAVEQFAIEYPTVPLLVTSRAVGYEQAALDKVAFSHFRLAPLDETQVSTYVTKLFSVTRMGSGDLRKRLAEAFMAESALIPDIRSNPLMLGLLCNLYRQDGYIPKNRPEVYQRCADLMFSRWDSHRGINIRLPMSHRLRPVMGHLAYWIYCNEKLQTGVTEGNLVRATAKYLSAWCEDRDEAEMIAKQFVEFFRGRAWVFSDTGSNREEPLYQFTHRTFLEYFTADHLVREHSDPARLHEQLISHVRVREWDVVCQLAYQISVQQANSHDLLIGLLCDASLVGELQQRINVMSFLMTSLDMLYPTPPARRRAVRLCVEAVIFNFMALERQEDLKDIVLEMFAKVLDPEDEVTSVTLSEIKTAIIDAIKKENLDLILRKTVVRFASGLPEMIAASGAGDDRIAQLHTLSREISIATTKWRLRWARDDQRIAILAWWSGDLAIEQLLKKFGPQSLFMCIDTPLTDLLRRPIAQFVLEIGTAKQEEITKRAKHRMDESRHLALAADASKAAHFLCDIPLPWKFGMSGFTTPDIGVDWSTDVNMRESALVCFAALSESTAVRITNETSLSSQLELFAASHNNPWRRDEAVRMVERLCEGHKVKDFLRSWINGGELLVH